MSKKVKLIIAVIILIIIVVAILGYWQHEKYYPSTDDAYVKANIVNIAAEVNGKVDHIYIRNNQHVKKGQLLFSIDPRAYRYQLTQAQADLRKAQQNMNAEEDGIKTAQATVKQRRAELIEARKNYQRYMTLVKENEAPKSQGDEVISRLRSSKAALAAAQSEVLRAQAELGDDNEQNADLQAAIARVNSAKLNLQHCHVYAPNTGRIANFNLRIGDVLNANQTLFSLIEDNIWWVDANYKETNLTRIRPGQKAVISVDIYPNYTFKGVVNSISSGSGSVFSILPAENATGNWVKVTQRFPVKIIITNPSKQYPLRVGASATVTVNANE